MIDLYNDNHEPVTDEMVDEILDAMEDDYSVDDSDERDIDLIAGITDEDVDNLVVHDEEIDSIEDDLSDDDSYGDDSHDEEDSYEDNSYNNNNTNFFRDMEEDLDD